MGKVRYKIPSKNFEKNSTRNEENNLRVSIGKERIVQEYFNLNIENLIPYQKQARRSFDQNELQQLADTIREVGIRSPLTVSASKKEKGKFEVISGERRLRAAELAKIEKIPCIILNDEKNIEEIALIENIQRSDLHPIELGEALASLANKEGWGNITKLAKKIGKTQSTVSEHIAYSKLPQSIKKYLTENIIKARDTLRKLLKAENVEEMESILGIKCKNYQVIKKNVLRINIEQDKIHIQDKQIYNLGKEQRENLKSSLLSIIDKIDKINNIQ